MSLSCAPMLVKPFMGIELAFSPWDVATGGLPFMISTKLPLYTVDPDHTRYGNSVPPQERCALVLL